MNGFSTFQHYNPQRDLEKKTNTTLLKCGVNQKAINNLLEDINIKNKILKDLIIKVNIVIFLFNRKEKILKIAKR